MKTKLFTTLFFVAALFCIGCSDNENLQDQLPPITQTGANTFGCVINGEVLIPKDGIGVPLLRGLEVGIEPNNNFYISSTNLMDTNGLYIYIYINNLTSSGIYNIELSEGLSINHFTPNYPHVFCSGNNNSQRSVYHSNTNSGTITITRFDPTNHIVSGTFELTAFNKNNPNETIEITEGRFDVNWVTL